MWANATACTLFPISCDRSRIVVQTRHEAPPQNSGGSLRLTHMACRRFLKLKVRLSHQTAGAAEGFSVEASDAAATSRRLARTSRHIPYFFSQTAKASAKARYP